MSARYRKIDPRFWRDEKVRRLSLEQKAIALYCITAQSNRIGTFNFSPAQAAEELGMRPVTFAKGFEGVCRTLGFRWDSRARVLYLPTWWKYNAPENPNVLKSCLADLHDLANTPLLIEFSANLTYLPETFHETFQQTLAKGYPQPMPNQEQEPDPDQDQDQDHEQEQKKPRARARSADDVLTWFETKFKPAYPEGRRVQSKTAIAALRKIRPSPDEREAILRALAIWLASPEWASGTSKFIPGMGKFFEDGFHERRPASAPAPDGRKPGQRTCAWINWSDPEHRYAHFQEVGDDFKWQQYVGQIGEEREIRTPDGRLVTVYPDGAGRWLLDRDKAKAEASAAPVAPMTANGTSSVLDQAFQQTARLMGGTR